MLFACALVLVAIGAVVKVYDPSDRALEADAARAAERILSGKTQDDVRVDGPLEPFSARSSLDPRLRDVRATAELRAVDGDVALAMVTAKSRVTVSLADGTRSLTAVKKEDGAELTQRLKISMSRIPGRGWVASRVAPQKTDVAYARPALAAEAELADAKALTERAVEEFLTYESDDTVGGWQKRQEPFYALALPRDPEEGGGDASLDGAGSVSYDTTGAPQIDPSDGGPYGPLPDTLRLVAATDGETDTSVAVDLRSSSARGPRILDAEPLPARDEAVFQHVEVTGRVGVSAEEFSSCFEEYGGFGDSDEDIAGTASGIVGFKAELVRSRLTGTSRWYVSRLGFDVEGHAVRVAEAPLLEELKSPEEDLPAWLGADDEITANC